MQHRTELVIVTVPSSELIREYEDFVGWLRSAAEIRSGIALASMPHARRVELTSLFGQGAAESIALTLQERMALWTDDATVPMVMHAAQQIMPRTWTQLVAERLRAERCITDDRFADLLAQLIAYHYQHTQCMPATLLTAAKRSGWDVYRRPLSDVLAWLGNDNIKGDGVLGVTVGALRLVWRNALAHQREDITKAISRALAGRSDGRDLVRGIASATMRMFPLEPDVAEHCRVLLLRSLEDLEDGDATIVLP